MDLQTELKRVEYEATAKAMGMTLMAYNRYQEKLRHLPKPEELLAPPRPDMLVPPPRPEQIVPPSRPVQSQLLQQ